LTTVLKILEEPVWIYDHGSQNPQEPVQIHDHGSQAFWEWNRLITPI
jgi:hypothetical protein